MSFWADTFWAPGFWATGFWQADGGTGQVTVPDVTNSPTFDVDQATATTTLTNAGLNVTAIGTSHPTIAVGNVVNQSPVAGTVVATGSTEIIRISTGPASATSAKSIGHSKIGRRGIGKAEINDRNRHI